MAVLLVGAGCFDPAYPVDIPCSDAGTCPPNETCYADHVCRLQPRGDLATLDRPIPDLAAHDAPSAEASIIDGAMVDAPVPDLATPDLWMPDLWMPDLSGPDLGPCGGRCSPSDCMSGRCITALINTPYPGYLTVDTDGIYWGSTAAVGSGMTSVFATDLDGNNQRTLVSGQTALGGIAVVGATLYWAALGNCAGAADGAVYSVPKAGGAGSTSISGPVACPGSLTANPQSLYWREGGPNPSGSIFQVPLGGGGIQSISTGLPLLLGLAADANAVYFFGYTDPNNSSAGVVARHPFTGSETRWTGLSPGCLTVDGVQVYWCDFPDRKVWGAPLTGGNPITVAAGAVMYFVADGTNAYYVIPTAGGGYEVLLTPISGAGPVTTIYATTKAGVATTGMAIDPMHVYWTELSSMSIGAPSQIIRAETQP
jgi:hypothetical protein